MIDRWLRVFDAVETTSGLKTEEIILAIQTRDRPTIQIGWHDIIVMGFCHENGWIPEHVLLAIEDIHDTVMFFGNVQYPIEDSIGFFHWFYSTFTKEIELTILLSCDYGADIYSLFLGKENYMSWREYEREVMLHLEKEGMFFG